MLTKKQVLSAVKNMPDTFDIEQLFDKISLITIVEEGGQELRRAERTGQTKYKTLPRRFYVPVDAG
jgi:hypothetical protein